LQDLHHTHVAHWTDTAASMWAACRSRMDNRDSDAELELFSSASVLWSSNKKENHVGGRNWDRAKADKVRLKEASDYIRRDWGPGMVGTVSALGYSTDRTSVKPTRTPKLVKSAVITHAGPTKSSDIKRQLVLSKSILPSPIGATVQIPTLPARHRHLDRLVSDLAVVVRQRNMLLVKSITAEIYLLASL
jgi:hypothetical protein